MNNERNYGIDLLRLVLMFMVCMLHVLGHGGVMIASYGYSSHSVYMFLEVLSYCAVDAFAFISGYTAKDSKRKYEKYVDMWFQAFFYSFILTTVLSFFKLGSFDIKQLLPVTFGSFWYFTAYTCLFFAIPVLNKFLFNVDEVNAKKMFIILLVMFSGLTIIFDPFDTEWGYSAIWLMVLYCLGVLGKKIRLFESRKTITLVILFLLSTITTWAFNEFETSRLINYTSPTVLLCGILLVCIFARLKPSGKLISKLSPLAFGIYLYQTNIIVGALYEGKFKMVVDKNIFVGVALVFGFAALLFVLGLAIEFIRSKLHQLLKVSSLSKKIVELADKLLEKLFVFIK